MLLIVTLLTYIISLMISEHVQAITLVSSQNQEQLQQLANSNGWQRLLHYQPQGKQFISQIDDPAFFLHPQGKNRPLDELIITIKQLEASLNQPLDEPQDLRCRFPARVNWLKHALHLNVPNRACPNLDNWLLEIDAGSLTLAFPAAYLNNAASMFGHSLLRIDSKDRSSRPDLVTWAVNYAAQANPDDGAITYAMKGMFGLYPGYFSLMPYYEKVNEYSHLENRDIWEYPLAIDEKGMQRVLWHLWELDKIRFDYWFFDENCSYQLLALLSVAQDELDLTSGFKLKALPVDTIRALDQAGLLQQAGRFRPSFATQLNTMSQQVSATDIQAVKQLVFEQRPPQQLDLASDSNTARIYELAFQWLNFRHQHQGLPREQASEQLHQLLVARSKVAEKAGFTPGVMPKVAPHQGHDTALWSLASGHDASGNYLQLAAKPAYHSRFDAVEGYLPSAEINLLELSLRYHHSHKKLQPWHLNLVEVGNYLSSSPIFKLAAWRTRIDIGRTGQQSSARDDWRSRTGGGYGRAWGQGDSLMGYSFFTLELEHGPQAGIRKPSTQKRWALGSGLASGFVWQSTGQIRSGMDVQSTKFFSGARGTAHQLSATVQWNYQRNQAWRLRLSREMRHNNSNDLQLAWLKHF